MPGCNLVIARRSPRLLAMTVVIGLQALYLAAVNRAGAKLFLDAEELVVLRHAVGAAERTGLDLAGIGRDRDVGDRDVFGLARAVADDGGVVRLLGHLDGVERLGERTNLVHLHENR